MFSYTVMHSGGTVISSNIPVLFNPLALIALAVSSLATTAVSIPAFAVAIAIAHPTAPIPITKTFIFLSHLPQIFF